MNDEVREVQVETFNRIVLGAIMVGLVMSIATLFVEGFSSPWFVRGLALIIAAVMAALVRLVGRLVVASYVLVFQLFGLSLEVFLRSGSSSVTSYIFIPVVLIAGLLLSPTAALTLTGGIVLLILITMAIADQFTVSDIALIIPALVCTLIAGLLAVQNRRNLSRIGQLLFENRTILRARTLELMESIKQVEQLKQRIVTVEKELSQVHSQAHQARNSASQQNTQLYKLFQSAIREFNSSIRNLEQSVEALGDMPQINGYAGSIETIWQKIYHLRAMLINLEEIAQVENSQFELRLESVDVVQLINEVAGTAKGLLFEKDIKIRTQIDSGLPTVLADPTRLRQVLLQIVSNAIIYTDVGTIEIGAKEADNTVVIQISDTGMGMKREEVDLIFETFGRGESTQAKQRQGGGLGLAISKRLVELHGGQIWVSSVPNVGTTFFVGMPINATQNYPAPANRREHDVPVKTSHGSKPLSVDDRTARVLPHRSGPPLRHDDATVLIGGAAQKKTEFENDVPAVILRRQARQRPRQATGPIYRFMPFYIQRFGYILLSMLAVVIVVVSTLAVFNYASVKDSTTSATALAFGDSKPTTSVQSPVVITATSTPQALPTFTATLPPTSAPVLGQVDPSTPATLTQTPTALPSTATPSPTLPPPSPTPTPLPPTVTALPSPTLSPTPAPTVSIPATPTPKPILLVTQMQLPAAKQAGVVVNNNNRSSWSPQGQLLFAGEQNGQRDIYVTDPASGLPVNITQSASDDHQPSWSPAGSQVAFSSGRTGNFDIFVANADGSNPVQLTTSRGFDEWPVWSPDGRQIAFVSDRDGNVELYLMNSDGTNQQRLTNHPADDWPAAWSPDGRWLVFASNRDGNWNLYVISTDGSPPIRLTNYPGAERDPIWSPDGKTIAFVHDGAGNFDVYTLPVNDPITETPPDTWAQITNTPQDERYPDWGASAENQIP